MRRVFPFLAVALLTLSAEQLPPESAIPPSRFNVLLNPFLGPVAGAPVTATFVINVQWQRVDGGIEMLDSTFKVARDSRGRISHELRGLVPASFTAAPPFVGVVLYDPPNKTSQTIDQATRTDVELQGDLPTDSLSASNIASLSGIAEIEDLGEKRISGLEVKGIRCTWKAPAQASLTGQPSQTSIESCIRRIFT